MSKLKLKKCELKNVVLTHRSSTSPYFILSISKSPISKKTLEERLDFNFTTLMNGLMNAFQDMSEETFKPLKGGIGREIYDIKMKSKDKEANLYRYLVYMLPDLKDSTSNKFAGKMGLMSTAAGNDCMLYFNFKGNNKANFEEFSKNKNTELESFDRFGELYAFVLDVGNYLTERGLSDLVEYASKDNEVRYKEIPPLLIYIIDEFLPEDIYCYVTIADHTFRSSQNPEPLYTGNKYKLFQEKAELILDLIKDKKDIKLDEEVSKFLSSYSAYRNKFGKLNPKNLENAVDASAGDFYFIFSNPLFVKLNDTCTQLLNEKYHSIKEKADFIMISKKGKQAECYEDIYKFIDEYSSCILSQEECSYEDMRKLLSKYVKNVNNVSKSSFYKKLCKLHSEFIFSKV